MMRPQPLICVREVEASSKWYQQLLNCQSAPVGRTTNGSCIPGSWFCTLLGIGA